MEKTLTEFKNWLLVNSKANNTITSYIKKISVFLSLYPEVNKENIEAFILSLKEKKLSSSTINTYLYAISTFLQFKGLEIRLPRSAKLDVTLPDAISIEDFTDKIIPMVDLTFKNPEKVEALLYMMFYTGLRPSEIATLRRENFDFENKRGKVFRHKRKTWGYFPLHDTVIYHLKRYFVTENQINNAFNITTSGLRRITLKLKKDFPNINLRPYLFRHSYATRLLKKKFNLAEIQQMLGHSSIQSTMRYIRVDVDDIINKYNEKFEEK